jgi:hypothetical protein
MQSKKEPQQSTILSGKIIGITLLFGIIIVMVGQFFIATNIIVSGNSAETAKNIVTHETQFRLWIICNLFYIVNMVVLLSALYIILRPVSHGLGFAAAVFKFIYVTMWVIIVFNQMRTLQQLTDGKYLQVFETERLQIFATLNLGAGGDAYYAGLPFYALSSVIFSYLWLKSKLIPRVISIFGIIASVWCGFCAFAYIALPNFDKAVNVWWFDTPMAIVFESGLGLWLLFKGLKKK